MARIIGGALRAAPDGHLLDLRSGHGARVLYAMHSATCPECRDYIRALAANSDLLEWGGHLTILVRDSLDAARSVYENTNGPGAQIAEVLADPGRSVPLADGAIAVTDEWGEVYFESPPTSGHQELPPPEEIVNWVRFVAIQCPECVNVEGDWRNV